MVRTRYSAKFKELAVKKYLDNKNKGLGQIASELCCSKSALQSWVVLYKNTCNTGQMNKISRRPQDWKAEEKISAIFEYEKLSELERGEFLRKNGLHSSHINNWRNHCLDALDLKSNFRISRTEFNEAHRKIKELKLDLDRKNKALAETSALLILKKKADLIFGHEEKK